MAPPPKAPKAPKPPKETKPKSRGALRLAENVGLSKAKNTSADLIKLQEQYHAFVKKLKVLVEVLKQHHGSMMQLNKTRLMVRDVTFSVVVRVVRFLRGFYVERTISTKTHKVLFTNTNNCCLLLSFFFFCSCPNFLFYFLDSYTLTVCFYRMNTTTCCTPMPCPNQYVTRHNTTHLKLGTTKTNFGSIQQINKIIILSIIIIYCCFMM